MKPSQSLLVVSPKTFIIIWWGLQLFHAFCIVNAIATIEIHWYFIVHDLPNTISYLGPTVFSYFKPVIGANIVLIIGHGIAFLQTVWWSVKNRQWRFTSVNPAYLERCMTRETIVKGDSNVTRSKQSIHSNDDGMQSTGYFKTCIIVLNRLLRVFATVGTALYHQIDKFSIEGTYYEIGFFVLEVVEISFQTYQAYKLSGLVPRVWINRLYAIVLVLNCWSTVIVHTALRHNRLVKRVLLLFVDGFFDMITSMVIPFVIIYPYYQQFDLTIVDFPLVNYYDDVWWIQAVSENQQVFVTSWLDFISKISTSFSIFATTLVLKQYLVKDSATSRERRRVFQTPACVTTSVPDSPQRTHIHEALSQTVPVVPTESLRVPADDTSLSTRPVMDVVVSTKPKRTWKDDFLVLYGLTILVVHVHATAIAINANVSGCLLEVRPWFMTTYTCAAFEINCAQGQFDNGRDVDRMNQLTTRLNIHGVKSFMISSCADLHVPRLLQSFSAMQMMKVYNTTIERWEADAEFHEELHHDFQVLYFCDVNFSAGELPVGMLGAHMPSRFVDIELSGTNLERLPSDLHQKWSFIYYFVLERSPQITEIPETLVRMPLSHLFVGSNSIALVPDDFLANQSFEVLRFDGNPLSKLPDNIGTIGGMDNLGFSFTFVSSLPPWMTTTQYDTLTGDVLEPYINVYAGASPLCLDVNDTTRTKAQGSFVWNCSTQISPFTYPVEQERRWRAASTTKIEQSGHGV